MDVGSTSLIGDFPNFFLSEQILPYFFFRHESLLENPLQHTYLLHLASALVRTIQREGDPVLPLQ